MTRFFSPSLRADGESKMLSEAARQLIDRLFPRADVYREWRQNRFLYGAAVVLMLFPLLQGAGDEYVSFNQTGSRLAVYFFAIVIGLGTLVMRADRSGIAYALTGTAMRRDVLRVKAGLGLAAFIPPFCLPWLVYTTQHRDPNGLWQPGVMAVAVFTHLLTLSALYLTALAAACTVGNPLLAGAGAVLAAAVPVFVSAFISLLFRGSFYLGAPLGHENGLTQVIMSLQYMSPLDLFGFAHSDLIVGPYLLWFAAWCVGFWKFGAKLWGQVPVERMAETFWYPKLRRVVRVGVAFAIALVIAQRADGAGPKAAWISVFFVVLAGAWWVIRRFTAWISSRRGGEPT